MGSCDAQLDELTSCTCEGTSCADMSRHCALGGSCVLGACVWCGVVECVCGGGRMYHHTVAAMYGRALRLLVEGTVSVQAFGGCRS